MQILKTTDNKNTLNLIKLKKNLKDIACICMNLIIAKLRRKKNWVSA